MIADVQEQFARARRLREAGRLDEAIALYRGVLQGLGRRADPLNLATVEFELANALHLRGNMEEASACFAAAARHDPGFAEAHYNLAIVLAPRDPEAAIAACRRALAARPDFPEATRNLALLLSAQGKPALAASVLIASLRTRETDLVKGAFVEVVGQLRWTRDDPQIREFLIRALMEPWGRAYKLVRSATSLLMLDSVADTRFDDPLLKALLRSAPLCDIGLERALTNARCELLELACANAVSQPATTPARLEFYCALAQQCFINEYVYAHTDGELRQADALRESLSAALNAGTEVPPLCVAAVAAYRPLASLPSAARLLQGQLPGPVAELLTQQVEEPAREAQERAGITRLTDIDDAISLRVRSQYEESPYPRWVKMACLGAPRSVAEFLTQTYPVADASSFLNAGPVRMLIAGCGTGQHAIDAAWGFADTQVTAIDLSLNSLGYARRKTRELGLRSIEYYQADILRLTAEVGMFDVIESVGTLHHLADPWAGWRALLPLLRPHGLMKIGLYSAAARRPVQRIRDYIAARGWGSTPEEIRHARQELADLERDGRLAQITGDEHFPVTGDDFFTLSGCRDYLFHVNEHCLTLPQIDAFLRANDLTFLGFDVGADVVNAYRRRFPGDPACTNLAQWQAYENDHPGTFFTMYEFWVQHRARS